MNKVPHFFQSGSLEYTRKELVRLEARLAHTASRDTLNIMYMYTTAHLRALEEISKLGGNPYLEEIVHKLSLVYKDQTAPSETTPSK